MMRTALLFLSRRRWLRQWMETSSFAQPLTRRFIAGRTLEEELAVCRRLEAENILATLDHLGENVSSIEESRASRDSYLQILDRIAAAGLRATISAKPTQLGLDLGPNLGEDICLDNVSALVERARSLGSGVEIDMESSEYVDRTLRVVSAVHQRHGSVRAVIQAYLYRSEKDIDRLNASGIPVRLVKGAYREPATVAWPKKPDVDTSFLRLTKQLLELGTNPAIATHDASIIAETVRWARARKVEPGRFEFQMLYGIRRDLQRQLVTDGFRVRLYVPYGDAWYPYFMRRLAERPANVIFLARNLLRA
ncbi:MAG: proline dehydrogenase family protein [Bryobacteraceae bacterium]|jgi:proline dehydrogenase